MREVTATGKTVEEATAAGCAQLGLTRDDVSVEVLEYPVRKLFKTVPARVRVTAAGEEPEAVPQAVPTPEAAPQPQPAPPPEAAAKRPAPVEPAVAGPAPAPQKRAAPRIQPEPETALDLEANPRAAQAAGYLSSMLAAAGAVPRVSAVRQGDAVLLRVEGEGIAESLEINGDVIQSLSYLVDRAVNAGVDKKEAEYLHIRLDIAGYRNRREGELLALARRTGGEVAQTGRSRTLAPMNPYERLIIHTAIGEMEGVTSESIGSDTERRVVIKSLGANAVDGGERRPARRDAPRGAQGPRPRAGGPRGGDSRPPRGRGGDSRPRPHGHGERDSRSSTPEREFAGRRPEAGSGPVVPERREAISDGDDLPLYGKIEL